VSMNEQQAVEKKPKVIIMANLTKEEVFAVMQAAKRQLENPRDIAFAMATAHSLEMKLADLVDDIAKEHAYFAQKAKEYSQKTEQDGSDS